MKEEMQLLNVFLDLIYSRLLSVRTPHKKKKINKNIVMIKAWRCRPCNARIKKKFVTWHIHARYVELWL
jgi:hypothetical protein